VFEASPDALLFVDAGCVTVANAAAARLLGGAPGGQPAESLFEPGSHEPLRQLLRAARRAAGRPLSMRLAVPGPAGEPVAVEVSATAIDGEEGAAVLRVRDLREQVKAEEERQRLDAEMARLERLQALGRMADAVAHEMNNVLAVVMSVSSLARQEWIGNPAAADYGVILDAAQRGRDLAQQLLGFVRTGPAKRGPVDPDKLLHEVAALVRKASSGLVLVVEDRDAGGARLLGDEGQLQQALLALGLNAVDALGARGGRVVMRTRIVTLGADDFPVRSGAAPGDYARFEVEDSGPGFTPEALAHAFEPFFTTKGGQGTGLGLAAVWRAAHDHGGFAVVDPPSGQGARVVLHLPLARADRAREEDEAARRSPTARPGLAVMVDDEPSLRLSGQRILERLGYTVLATDRGAEALEMVGSRPGVVSVAVVDLVMPGMGGAELATRLRAIDPGLPLVVTSGYPVERIPADLLALPGVHFLPKPFSLDQFSAAVRRAARSRSA